MPPMSLLKPRFSEDPKFRLRALLAGLIVCISIPLIFLVIKAYTQFQWEMYYEYRWTAKHMVKDYGKKIKSFVAKEEARPFSDYQFYKLSSNTMLDKKRVMLSPLVNPVESESFPGLLGYFQIDEKGELSSPILPFEDKQKLIETGLHFEPGEVDERLRTLHEITKILVDKGMMNDPSAILASKRVEFIATGSSREDRKVDNERTPLRIPKPPRPPKAAENSRTESGWTPLKIGDSYVRENKDEPAGSKSYKENIEFIESKVEIGEFSIIEGSASHLLAVRRVWMGEKEITQGFAINKYDLIESTLLKMLYLVDFETPVMVKIDHGDGNISAVLPEMTNGRQTFKLVKEDLENFEEEFLFSELYAPLEHVGLKFSTNKIPMSSTSALAIYLMATVIVIVFVGMWVIYRLGLRQLKLNEERLNFVSAVSHELKTPLTSIIMYSDMLREGMVSDDDKKKRYYDFIFFESERLGRLIENVLRLSKLSRQNQGIQLEYTTIGSAIDLIQSKVSTLVEKNSIVFNIHLAANTDAEMKVLIDPDAFSQIVINLMDNAIKFSKNKDGTQQSIDVYFERLSAASGKEQVRFSVRDYGPGIDKANSAKIFDLFYRAGNEMTRTTPGTGIGLALVSELTTAMGGRLELVNHKPGAEFCIDLQAKS